MYIGVGGVDRARDRAGGAAVSIRLIRMVLSGALIAAGERMKPLPPPRKVVAPTDGPRTFGHYMRGAGQ